MKTDPGSVSTAGIQGQFDIDAVYIRSRTVICIALTIGGILSICVGCLLMILGKSGSDESLIKIAGAEFSGKGIGAVMMVSSVAWGFLAYIAAPKYTRMRRSGHHSDSGTGVSEHWETTASTADPFLPPTRQKPKGPTKR